MTNRRLPSFPNTNLIYQEEGYIWTRAENRNAHTGNGDYLSALLELLFTSVPNFFKQDLIPYIKCRYFNKHTPEWRDSNGVIACDICDYFMGWQPPKLQEGEKYEYIPGYKEPQLVHYRSGWGYEINTPEWKCDFEKKVLENNGYYPR